MRLDKFVSERLGVSRTAAQNLILSGLVQINQITTLKPDYKLQENSDHSLININSQNQQYDQIIVQKPAKNLQPENIPIEIKYEDEFLAIINKQSNLAVHPGAGNPNGTLANALKFHFGQQLSETDNPASIRPGIVHRLDKDTTGLMLIAKDNITHHKLSNMISSKQVARKYLGICYGCPKVKAGSIETVISRDRNSTKMRIPHHTPLGLSKSKHAITNYILQESLASGRLSLLEFTLQTGRTHQIRVHSEHIGHSILGDKTYGVKPPSYLSSLAVTIGSITVNAIQNIRRQMLHSYSLEFIHPITLNPILLSQKPPKDFNQVLSVLQSVHERT